MERRRGYPKMMNHSTKIQRTSIWPLRWIGNICGSYAGNHLVKCFDYDEDGKYGFAYKYHAKMWKCLNKPYESWGTYYTIDLDGWKTDLDQMRIDMADEGWDDYDAFGKAYWDDWDYIDNETDDAFRIVPPAV